MSGVGDTVTADFSDCSVLSSMEQQSRSRFPSWRAEWENRWHCREIPAPAPCYQCRSKGSWHALVSSAWQMLLMLPTVPVLLNLFYIPNWENDSFCSAIFYRRPLNRIGCNIFLWNVLLGESGISINFVCYWGVDSNIFVLNVLKYYVVKAKAKEGLISPGISGIFAGFKPGEHFLGRRLLTCPFLSWKLL